MKEVFSMDDEELIELLEDSGAFDELEDCDEEDFVDFDDEDSAVPCGEKDASESIDEEYDPYKLGNEKSDIIQYNKISSGLFSPCGVTQDRLDPSAYYIYMERGQLFYDKIAVKTENLVTFPDEVSGKVLNEIETFWSKEEVFKKYNLPYKRGIMLWGPPGSGKSCTVQLIMRDVIERGGVVFVFDHPGQFIKGYQTFRKIQPETPIVVVMEDFESIIEQYGEADVLQILDGVHRIHKTVFLATTNYPEKLKARIINRPSRFDKRFKIPHPNGACRKVYLEYILGEEACNIDIDKWVDDTADFSFAHLKELFVAVTILGDEYDDALETLRSMKKQVFSNIDEEFGEKNKSLGFGQ